METKIEDYMDMWKRSFEAQEKYMDEIRSIKHDMQAHLIVLQYYMEEGKYEEAKAYLQVMRNQKELQQKKREIELGHPLINVLIKEYLDKSPANILFSSKGQVFDKTQVTDYDWCIIFSNLLSNAVEACEKLKCAEKRISVEIKERDKELYIRMENPVEWDVDIVGARITTSKEEKERHGFGLQNLRKTVEKYEGGVSYQCEENRFWVEVRLPDRRLEAI